MSDLQLPLIIDHPFVEGGGASPLRPDAEELEIILLMHGWPDSSAVWDRQVKALCATGRYICIRYDLPWYSPDGAVAARKEATRRGYSPVGYDFNAIGDAIARAVLSCPQLLRRQGRRKGTEDSSAAQEGAQARRIVNVVCHDWGCVAASYFQVTARPFERGDLLICFLALPQRFPFDTYLSRSLISSLSLPLFR